MSERSNLKAPSLSTDIEIFCGSASTTLVCGPASPPNDISVETSCNIPSQALLAFAAAEDTHFSSFWFARKFDTRWKWGLVLCTS